MVFVFHFTLRARARTHTHMQSTDARRALPCWDEPAHKATFDVTLVVPKDKVALSNMVSASSPYCICIVSCVGV